MEQNENTVEELQKKLATIEEGFDPLRQKRVFGGPEWQQLEKDAAAVRMRLFDLTGDYYGRPKKQKPVKPDDALLEAEYASPDDIPAEVMAWVLTRSSLLYSDATDAVRWSRIVDSQRDDRYPAGEMLTLYRAVGDDVGADADIRPGDWVTTMREYAEEHLEKSLSGRGFILQMEADGRDVLVSPTGNAEEAIYAPYELSGPLSPSQQRTTTNAMEKTSTKKVSLAAINKALREYGVTDELFKGKGYFYFWGDKASTWQTSSVPVYKITDLSFEEWLEEYENLSGEKLMKPEQKVVEVPENLQVEQFPILAAQCTERRLESFKRQLNAISNGLKDRAIPNPVFKDAKDILNRIVEDGYKAFVQGPFFYGGKWQSLPQEVKDLDSSIRVYGVHDCKAAMKRVRATKATGPEVAAMKAFFNEVEPLVAALDALKPLIVKRVQLTQEEKEAAELQKYTPPLASAGAQRAVYDVLLAITERHYQRMAESFKNAFTRNVDEYLGANEKRRSEMNRNPWSRAGVHEATNSRYVAGKYQYTLKPDADAILQRMAEREAQDIQRKFIFKNLKKFASIVDRRGDFDRAEEVSGSVSLGGLTGAIRVYFKDGSQFLANNSVVWSTSVHGKPFMRFPLTFHDVVMADGTKIANPSEEKMNEIFAGGKKVDPMDLVQQAEGRFSEGEEGSLEVEQARWALEEAFPLEKLGDLQDLKDRFMLECAKAENEGRADAYEDMKGKPIHTPVVILLRQGKPYVWDGEIRAAAAASNGETTISAIVGVPLEELTQEKTVSQSAAQDCEP